MTTRAIRAATSFHPSARATSCCKQQLSTSRKSLGHSFMTECDKHNFGTAHVSSCISLAASEALPACLQAELLRTVQHPGNALSFPISTLLVDVVTAYRLLDTQMLLSVFLPECQMLQNRVLIFVCMADGLACCRQGSDQVEGASEWEGQGFMTASQEADKCPVDCDVLVFPVPIDEELRVWACAVVDMRARKSICCSSFAVRAAAVVQSSPSLSKLAFVAGSCLAE